MINKLKAIILLIALVIGGIFIANMSPSDDKLKRQNNQLKSQIVEMTNLNDALKNQNKRYESTIGDLTTESNFKDETIGNLQSQNQEKDTTIEELQEQIEELERQVEELSSNLPVTDLLDTTWILNDTISAPAGYGIYQISFDAYFEEQQVHFNGYPNFLGIGYTLEPDFDGDATYMPTAQADTIGTCPSFQCHTNEYKTIDKLVFLGSLTDKTLIDWLYANATLVK